jgi:hypothetical protein
MTSLQIKNLEKQLKTLKLEESIKRLKYIIKINDSDLECIKNLKIEEIEYNEHFDDLNSEYYDEFKSDYSAKMSLSYNYIKKNISNLKKKPEEELKEESSNSKEDKVTLLGLVKNIKKNEYSDKLKELIKMVDFLEYSNNKKIYDFLINFFQQTLIYSELLKPLNINYEHSKYCHFCNYYLEKKKKKELSVICDFYKINRKGSNKQEMINDILNLLCLVDGKEESKVKKKEINKMDINLDVTYSESATHDNRFDPYISCSVELNTYDDYGDILYTINHDDWSHNDYQNEELKLIREILEHTEDYGWLSLIKEIHK